MPNRGQQPQAGLGVSTERKREAGREPSRTEGPHWGRCGEAAASCQEWGSRALTALLPQEHQLEFPQRIPEVSARGHDEAEGAAAASAQRPRTDAAPIGRRKRGEEGPAPSSLGPCRARRRSNTGEQDSSPQTGSRRRRLPAESPSTKRPAAGKGRMAVSEAARGVL